MEIPADRLPLHILDAVIEEFVTREGTDYGHSNHSLPQKVEQVRVALHKKEAVIVFDEESGSCNIVLRQG